MAFIGRCKVINGGLNLRNSMSTTAPSPGQVPSGHGVHVTADHGGWVYCNYRANASSVIQGYAVTSTTSGLPTLEQLPTTYGPVFWATVTTTSGNLNVRALPSTGANVIGTLAKGARIQVAEVPGYPDWYTFAHNGESGFVSKTYVTRD